MSSTTPHVSSLTGAAAKPRPGLRIGIDGDALRTPLSGVGQYVYQLCAALEPLLSPRAELLVYTRHPRAALALPSARFVVRQEPRAALRRLPSFVWLKTRGRRMCARDGIDAFWAGRTLHPSLAAPVRTVCTVHDLNHLLVPQTMQPATRVSHALWFARDVRRADGVIANSEGTARRLAERLGVEADAVVYPGVDARFRPLGHEARARTAAELAKHDIRPPYLLCVGTLEPRKNVSTTFRAFLALKEAGQLPNHQLVLAGARGWQDPALARALSDAHAAGVRLPGFVPDALLPGLYALADLVLVPSLYEGFGMPALEARACGARVLVSETPELREAAGPRGVAVEPTVEGLRAGIVHALALDEPPDELPGAGHTHHAFRWDLGARQLATLLGALPA
ncbi:MAG: glycosyltransferase family 1 protein [Polyangiales bacterium]